MVSEVFSLMKASETIPLLTNASRLLRKTHAVLRVSRSNAQANSKLNSSKYAMSICTAHHQPCTNSPEDFTFDFYMLICV